MCPAADDIEVRGYVGCLKRQHRRLLSNGPYTHPLTSSNAASVFDYFAFFELGERHRS